MLQPFSFARIPNIIFGVGSLTKLYDIISNYGTNILLVTGGTSLDQSGKWKEISSNLKNHKISYERVQVQGEPSPEIIDQYAASFRDKDIDLIIGIGGGSVTDAGKAISAMIPKGDSILNYLEGVGEKTHDGTKIPYIAIPTTSGTGSEATKNAVISKVGPEGFKKSLRHDNLVPDYAIIDPTLMISCPPDITAACGMDALTQLIESYNSTSACPMTDALAYSGINYMKDEIIPACGEKASNLKVRTEMAYGSLISGICLANAGLGIVHGLASPIGGFFNIPHGVVCGTLISEAIKMNVKHLKTLGDKGLPYLRKYAEIGAIFAGKNHVPDEKIAKFYTILMDSLDILTEKLQIERLGKYGITSKDLDKIVDNTDLKNNPAKLTKEDIKYILMKRL
ncbi:MAG: iron-containing alcohol dehydrogenase [Promethearchaeota archaeon]